MNKDVTILFDFNNLLFRNFFIKDIGANTTNPDYMLWRYHVYNSIYQSLWKVKKVKEVILAVDDKNSWRKSYFPRYKESRKKQRDKTDVDWKALYNEINKLVADMRHYMPFKVIKIMSAEADDVIAVLCKNLKNKCIIISNDEDYKQLNSNRVKIYHPSKKEYLPYTNPENFVLEKIMIGQKKDDIFNIITPDDWGQTKETEGKRKPGFGPVAYEKVVNGVGIKEWLKTPYKNKLYGKVDLEKNFKRNRILMDFNKIPNTILNRILNAYENCNFPPPSNIYQFFKIYNMRGFLEDFTQVENKLLQLY